ncbi:TIGR04222 domain-containing membrane protein [Candidatus Albibeggiatoa sp. nov. NOAA]|uniref:TIGR04222 domain-containing membrane protein n=1 Tax=Candidatus Albibeggiatoa sp. nov. NOAA TaxID=3162724 RepID=UPI0032FDFE71|nr:TIGR04222 domain-containing membrane protein [Thiotrichaceae bacterium]
MESFINITGVQFLVLFPTFSLFAIIAGYWIQRRDNTGQYHTPSVFSLSVMETAALSGERENVIHTAIFKLWQEGTLSIKGFEDNAYVLSNKDKDDIRLENEIEKALFSYISNQPNLSVKFSKLFQPNSPLQTQLNIALEPIYDKLEKRHLRCDDRTFQIREQIKTLLPLIIFAIGFLKLSFGLWFGHPVIFLILLLIVIPSIAWLILPAASRQTKLGQRYLAKCRTKLRQTAVLQNEGEGVWRVAVFGAVGVQSWKIFTPFNNACGNKNNSGGTVYGGCGGFGGGSSSRESSSSSDSGGSAGCGGCGGGGCGGGGG